jgi:hypothetical protein
MKLIIPLLCIFIGLGLLRPTLTWREKGIAAASILCVTAVYFLTWTP